MTFREKDGRGGHSIRNKYRGTESGFGRGKGAISYMLCDKCCFVRRTLTETTVLNLWDRR